MICCLLFCSLTFAMPAFAQNADDSVQRANEAYRQKEFAKSAQLFANAINQGAKEVDVFYNAACSFALAGEKRRSLHLSLTGSQSRLLQQRTFAEGHRPRQPA